MSGYPLTLLLRTLVLLLLGSALAAAEDAGSRVFDDAKRLYAQGRHDSVSALLKPWIKSHGKDTSMESLVPLLLESLLRTHDRASFAALRDIYLKKFPSSAFTPRVQYLSGMAIADSSAFAATLAFSAALKSGAGGELATLALRNVQTLAAERLSIDELTGLFDRSDLFGEVRSAVGCALLNRSRGRVSAEQSKRIAEAVAQAGGSCTPLVEAPPTIAEKPLDVAVKAPPPKTAAKTRIGLLAPLSGANADAGRSVARGAELAVTLAADRGLSVELISLDTRGNYIETVRRTHELMHETRVPVIIGPVLSIEAAVAAGMVLEQGSTALISPTATEEGIASLSPNVFQLNLTLPALARRIAAYAVQTAGIGDFVILAPKSTYGKTLADHFRLEVKRLGGRVIAEESFAEGGADIPAAVSRLRTTAGGGIWAKSVSDGQAIEGYADRQSYLADAPIALGGIFIPAAAADAAPAAEACSAAKLSGQLLGSSGWQEPGLFSKGKISVEGALISGADASGEAEESRFGAFAALYKARFGELPDHVAAPLGYDAANLALEQIAAGRFEGKAIAAGLSKVKNWQGVSGMVSFDGPDGANTAASVLRVIDGRFSGTEH